MKSRYLPLLAALLTIGLLGASGSTTAAATIEYSISGAQAAAIEIIDIEQRNISDDIAAQPAIASAILAYDIQRSSIPELELSNPSLIAIAITQANIGDYQIAGAITQISA